MLHDLELNFIHLLHQFRTPLLDLFFKLLNFFDRLEFFFILIPIVWIGAGWKTGLRLFYILLLSALTNLALKEFFLSPRPYHLDPSLGIIQVSGLGFPSGAAQTVILLSGILLNFWKSTWKWVLVLSYIVLVSFSRIYLGLHFPSDILAGWMVGYGLWAVYTYVFPPIERQLQTCSAFSLLLLSLAIPAQLLVWQYSIPTARLCGVAMGLGVGLYCIRLRLLSPPAGTKEYILRVLIGISGIFLCYTLTQWLPTTNSIFSLLPRFFLLGLWLAWGSPLVSDKFFSKHKISSKGNP